MDDMAKREAAMQQIFGRWLQYAYKGPTAAFELKRTLTDSLAISEIKAHQSRALGQVKTGFYYKIPDDTIAQKPFDCFWMKDVPAYVVIGYGKRLQGFYIIAEHFISRFKRTGLHSVTLTMAKQFGTYISISRDSSSVPVQPASSVQ